LVLSTGPDYQSGKDIFEKIDAHKADAVITMSDETAIGIMHSASDYELDIPGDIQILSCSNTRLVNMVRPSLSSIALPLYDIGAVGMRLLTKYMKEETVDEANVILPYKIEYRKTT